MTPEVRRGRQVILAATIVISMMFLAAIVVMVFSQGNKKWFFLFKLAVLTGCFFEVWGGSERARKASVIVLALFTIIALIVAGLAGPLEVIAGALALAFVMGGLAYALCSHSVSQYLLYRREPWRFEPKEDDETDDRSRKTAEGDLED